ncbi:ABC-F family ATP-binding cassette domain-containing protein [Flavobacterium sp. JP2137]|uniref:ABC-F family ATP-binding cassette domain-containing protein n=1 Tax=Flavobacterium sp. JP2137 TaxID=3414510 RepID=UPI003D300379
MIVLQDITYLHSDKSVLFSGLHFNVQAHDKISLVGNNGVGKSTLLNLIAGNIQPQQGRVFTDSKPYYVPQHFGQFNGDTVAQALHIADKLHALEAILKGEVSEENLRVLDDDWNVEVRSQEALEHWQLHEVDLHQKMDSLSGGQKTRVFLAGIRIHQPQIALLDEPSNHLDAPSRVLLYDYIETTRDTLVVVSHDRVLLNKIHGVCELSSRGMAFYGGNYDFYLAQKQVESEAMIQDVNHREKALRKAKAVERDTLERQQKLDARGKKKQEKAGIATIMMKTLKNKAENTASKLKGVHGEKREALAEELSALRRELPDVAKMKIDFDNSDLHRGKTLLKAQNINFKYGAETLWNPPLSFEIRSGERWAIKGANGSGKTTLIQLMLGALEPLSGSLFRADMQAIYIDQDYSLIDNALSVYEQALVFNDGLWEEHQVKMRLNRFLFGNAAWSKPCSALSGGEKMRLMLCALTLSVRPPDLIVLDEPTNNLDIQNLEILTQAILDYRGTLLVVSHDAYFLNQIQVERDLSL